MKKFKDIQNNHLALTQYYRWYQVYEVPFNKYRLENQLDILGDEIEISSQAGTSKGKSGLEDRLKMFEGWQNAHHVENTSIKQLNDEELSLEADILYQNIRPDDSRYSYRIHYSTILKLRENDLPPFTKVHIEPIGNVENPQFTSAYADNRAKSFMHYWLYLMETASVNGDKFKELLAEQFELNLSTGSEIDTLKGFNEWLATASSQVKQSGHYPKNLSVTENVDNTINVSVDFEWEGISVDNKPMVAETHHEWVLENNLDERFARMRMMKVTQTKPFQIVE
ncbi:MULTISPECIES: hypothetical protein [Bacillus]|uniref:Uncharacterized protein n=2 Tax=Bacillus pseudomycoides TaxID=64104 RepID=A0A1Y3M678_9BACI|nr:MULTISPECIES: hypothetical protein [Bacillus cereus group]EOP54787.1 hypothetical protein IIW_00921 [Bacillus cereus VD136]EOP72845.1 hypothetical protein KOW_00255 [Bacillus cereus VDM006]EOQ10505.1 hypothetical protein KOY_04067 [Bacillus cereus VDM021]OOG89865.1 hypothetical protein BTH41_04421 [Bacillus mycoides]MDF2083089.1 hypothetical protein [Bacillus pseudomycoides]